MKIVITMTKAALFLFLFLSLVLGLFYIGEMKVVPCKISNCEHDVGLHNRCSLYNPMWEASIYCEIKPSVLKREEIYLLFWIIFMVGIPFYLTRKILSYLYEKITNKKF